MVTGQNRFWRGKTVRVVAFARRGLFGLAVMLVALSAVSCSDGVLSQAEKADAAGDLESAVRLYSDYLSREPNDITALRGLAVDLYLMGRFSDALPYQEKVVALDSKDFQTRIELGFNYLNHQDEPGKAVAVLGEAATLEPSAKHMTFLAQAQLAAGEQEAAESTLRRAIEVDAGYGHAYVVLIGLLENQGRATEAATLREAALGAGLKIED